MATGLNSDQLILFNQVPGGLSGQLAVPGPAL